MSKPALKLAASRLTPEREQLAEAIATRDIARKNLEKVNDASEQLHREIRGGFGLIDTAEANLKQAKKDAPALITKRLLGEPDHDALSVADAETALRDAQEKHSLAKAAVAGMDDAIKECEQRIKRAEMSVKQASFAVVKSTVKAGIGERWQELQRQHHRLSGMIESLRLFCIPESESLFLAPGDDYAAREAGAAEVRACLEALAQDAEAEVLELP